MNLTEIRRSHEFNTFFNAGFDFCAIVENVRNHSSHEFLIRIHPHLLNLYSNGFKIPYVEPNSDIVPEIDIDIRKITNNLNLIIEHRFYWYTEDPNNLEKEDTVCGDLVDDFADIYKDLKTSLILYNLDDNSYQQDSIWRFKFDFENHWGQHCINALFAIHNILRNG